MHHKSWRRLRIADLFSITFTRAEQHTPSHSSPLKYGISQIATILFPSFLHMIPSSSGRGWVESESEGQIALSLSSCLYHSVVSVLLSLSLPTFHSHSGTLAFILHSVSPLQLLSLHFLLRPFHFSQFCSVIFTLSALFFFFPISFSWLAYWLDTQTHTESCAKTYTPELTPLRASGDHITNTPTQASRQSWFQAHAANCTET